MRVFYLFFFTPLANHTTDSLPEEIHSVLGNYYATHETSGPETCLARKRTLILCIIFFHDKSITHFWENLYFYVGLSHSMPYVDKSMYVYAKLKFWFCLFFFLYLLITIFCSLLPFKYLLEARVGYIYTQSVGRRSFNVRNLKLNHYTNLYFLTSWYYMYLDRVKTHRRHCLVQIHKIWCCYFFVFSQTVNV